MGRAGLHHKRRATLHGGGGLSSPRSVLGSNLRALWDSRVNASAATWTDSILGVPMTGSGTPTLGADALGRYAGKPVFSFNGTTQAFDTGDMAFDLVATGTKPYMWIVACAESGAAAASRIAGLTLNTGSTQLAFGDTDGNGDTNGAYTGAVLLGAAAAPQAQPSFWELYYDTDGTRRFARDGVVLASGAIATISTAVRRAQFGGFPATGVQFAKCSIAQVGICIAVPTAAQRAALQATVVRDFDTGPKTIAQVLGANLKFRVDAATGWSAGAWLDQIQALSLTGTGTPTRAADGANFRGKSVVTFNGTSQGYSGGSGNIIAATATRPYMYLVMRQIAGNASAAKVIQTHDNPTATEVYGFGDVAGAVTSSAARIEGANFGTFALPQATPSFWELYLDAATGLRTVVRDGAATTNGSAIVTSAAIQTVSIGAVINALQWCQCIVGEVVICAAAPNTATRGLLRAMQQEAYATP